MWIGTHGGGLSRFKDGQFATISARQGLYNDDIFQILEDDDANLWMNCNTGIWRTSLRQLNDVADGRRTAVESFAYGTADGMLSSEGVGANLAGWKMRDGSLWFPTTKGIVVIDPRRRDADPPRVVIEGITIDRQPAPIAGPVRVTPGQENIEIQYTGLSWSRPQAIKFRFRLDGTRSRLGGCRRASDGVLFACSTWFLHFHRDRRQWRRRVEHGREDARYRGPSALLPDVVVSDRGRIKPGGIGVGVLAISDRPD